MPTRQVATCAVCGYVGEFGPGPGGRPRAACPECGSLERHRALVGLLPALAAAAKRGCVVEVAPSRGISMHLKSLADQVGAVYLSLDFDPAADRRAVDVQASLTELPLADASVGLLLCLHVLEHVADDASAVAEIHRVLAPGGIAVIQVPRRAGRPTDEDPSAPPAERIARFGQADHVRYYGDDFEDRLMAPGLQTLTLRMADLYRDEDAARLGISTTEPVWLCTKGPGPSIDLLAKACAVSAGQTLTGDRTQQIDVHRHGTRAGPIEGKARSARMPGGTDWSCSRAKPSRTGGEFKLAPTIRRLRTFIRNLAERPSTPHRASSSTPSPAAPSPADALGQLLRFDRRRARLASEAKLLLASGLFDLEFYRAQQSDAPSDPHQAAAHFLKVGMPDLAAFHPAILPACLPSPVAGAWRAGNLSQVLRGLATWEAMKMAWSPWFHPEAEIPREPGGSARERFEELVSYLAGLTHETQLVGDPATAPLRTLTWGAVRTEAIRIASLHAQQRSLHQPRVIRSWDHAAVEAWMAELGSSATVTSSPLVSVIMPAWNRGPIIRAAISSVQAQLYTNWELLIVDDGSTDDTPIIAAEAAASDPRVRLIEGEHAGVCAARNRGIASAQGEFIAFLDTDNCWRPGFLELAVRAMVRDSLKVAYSGVQINRGDQLTPKYRGRQTSLEELQLFNHIDLNVVVVEAALLRAIEGFDEDLRRWVDHDLVLRLAEREVPKYLPFIGCDYYDDVAMLPRITTTESGNWQYAVLGKAWCDWESADAGLPARKADRISIVMPVFDDVGMTVRSVTSILENSGTHDIEINVIDNGSRPPLSMTLAEALYGLERVRLRRLPVNLGFGIGSNLGAIYSTGGVLLFLNNDTEVRPGWLDPLTAHLTDPQVAGVQPLLSYLDDTIQAAGTIFLRNHYIPTHFLACHPLDEAHDIADYQFPAVTAAALLMRAADFVALRGFDPIFVNGSEDIDLCLRARQLGGRHFVVEPRSIVTHLESKTPGRGARIPENRKLLAERWRGRTPSSDDLLERKGFRMAHFGLDRSLHGSPMPVLYRPERFTADPERGQVPVLRWGIRNPAPPGANGEFWGDTHVCAALAKELRRLGQEAVVGRREAAAGPASVYDDVTLTLRGQRQVDPVPGKTNVLWVISHPETVDLDELRAYDLVFAASESWAADMTLASGRPVIPLLQATDHKEFHPPLSPATREGVLFVGQVRGDGTPRQIVLDAITGGVDLAVWGPRWEGIVDEIHIRGKHLPYSEVPSAYRNSAVVLNDHWPDMAASGFMSNRLFDAVSSGARVVSDAVAGLELFGGAVQVYSSPEHLAYLCSPAGMAEQFPNDTTLTEIAARIRQEHSYRARVRVLTDAVLSHRGISYTTEP